MVKNRKYLIPRKPCVRLVREGIEVIGNDRTVAQMLAACVRTLESRGWDMSDLKKALLALKKMGEVKE